MKRIVILGAVLFTSLVSAAWAQQPTVNGMGQSVKPVYYDNFNEKWLDPAKWVVGWGPWCDNSLECVREIQNNRLRLAGRNFGATDYDSGTQLSDSELFFVGGNTINSITADVTLSSFTGVGCSTNDTDKTHTQVSIGGRFFNTGSGDPNDDALAQLILWVDTTDPTTINVGNWSAASD
jgi:hypothetical protein